MEKTFVTYFPVEEGKSGIKIKPENKGKFTATKKRTGKTTEELTHSKNPLTRKRAIFAQNAKKWKHEEGGQIEYFQDGGRTAALKTAATNFRTNSMSRQEYADSLYTYPKKAIDFYTANHFPTALNKAVSSKTMNPLLGSGIPVFYDQVWDKDGNRDKIVGFWDYLHTASTSEVPTPLTDTQMAAVFGNIYQESQFKNVQQSGGGPASSFLQMEPQRQKQYNAWIAKNKYADGDKTKLLYLSYLLQNPESSGLSTPYDTWRNLTPEQRKSGKYTTAEQLAQMSEYRNYTTQQAIKDFNSNDITRATRAALALFFKAGKPDQARRIKYANGMAQMFKDRSKKKKSAAKHNRGGKLISKSSVK